MHVTMSHHIFVYLISEYQKEDKLFLFLLLFQEEDQEGHDGSYIYYYMKEEQQEGVSVEMARERVIKMISNEWKQLNRECLLLNRSSASFQKCALNMARMVPLMYDYDSRGNLPFLEQYIGSMFYDDDICKPKGYSVQTQTEDHFFLMY